ncbi:MAG: ABC-type branched-subunit amino acid transport system substrate-binding protein [Planctomycetota bacterium]|jgi:ABC-type branched-subunit amino acid transport system substrate-binding protein
MNNAFKILFVLLFVSSFSSCKVKQNIKDVVIIDDNIPIIVDTPADTTVKENEKNFDELKDISNSNVNSTPSLKIKDAYNIAIILPLFSDSLNINWQAHAGTNLEDFNLPKETLISLSFLEGMMMALENKPTVAKLHIKVYDNQASLFQTDLILSKLAFESTDFIIGPVRLKNISKVSSFAKEKDIIMISPFSPSISSSNDFANYIMPKPGLDIHLKTITNFIKDSLSRSHVKVLYPNTTKGNKYAFSFEEILKTMNDSIVKIEDKISYALIEIEAQTNDRSKFKMEEHLDESADNSIIVLPAKSGFIHSMLTKLNEQKDDYKITVFGMPNWRNSRTLRLDYFNNLHVHFTDTEWINEDHFETKEFITQYKEEYKLYPSDNVFYAYDLFSFFNVLIDKYGLSIPENIHKEKYQGLINNYAFKTTYLNNQKEIPVRIENNALHVISFEDFKLHLEK